MYPDGYCNLYYLDVHLDDCFSDESSSEESPERDQEVAAGDSGKIEQRIRNLEKNMQCHD